MNIYEILNKLNIKYDEISHNAVKTVEEAQYLKNKIEGIGCKNLFLTDSINYYLVILEDSKRANIKELCNIIKTSSLSFTDQDKLKSILNLEPGSVTPFGIINDSLNQVTLLIDKDLINNKLLFHPNTNTKTINIDYIDLIKFIEYENHKYLNF